MSSIKDILNTIPATDSTDEEVDNLMQNADYLRHSSSIISDSLQKGCDVLQLENGDIITTGTKIVVTQYHWDEEAQKMVKLSAKERKRVEAQNKKQRAERKAPETT